MSEKTPARTPIDSDSYQFYRCYNCHEILTQLQVDRALHTNGKICRCGSMKIMPSEVKPLEYVKKCVIEMAIHIGFTKQEIVDDFVMETPDMSESDRLNYADEICKNYEEVLCN